MNKSKAPKAPTYIPPAPYQAPASYVAPPDPNAVIPKVLTPLEVMSQGAEAEAQLPSWLQLNSDPMNPAGRSQYEQNYQQLYVDPQNAQLQNDLYNSGQAYGSYGGAMAGQQLAMGQLAKYQAGLDYAQQLYNNVLQGRQSYYSGGPQLATNQNAADVARGTSIAQIGSANAANQNSYNLQSSGQLNNYNLNASGQANNYNLSNYGNQLNAYQQDQQQSTNRALGLGGLILGGLQGGAKLLSGKLGGGALGGATSAVSSSKPLGLLGLGGGGTAVGDFGLGLGSNFA